MGAIGGEAVSQGRVEGHTREPAVSVTALGYCVSLNAMRVTFSHVCIGYLYFSCTSFIFFAKYLQFPKGCAKA